MKQILYSILFAFVVLTSCRPQRAVFNYLEDVTDTSFRKEVYIAEPVIQKNDLLSIQIYSAALDPTVDALYNMPMQQMGGQGGQMGGYLVDIKGDVELPRIGKIHAEGLKKSELEAVIRTKLSTFLTSPNVLVRFANFRITVLGEAGGGGIITIPTERATILEVIGMAGGVSEFGTIKNVKILRENNGVRQLGILDLTSKEIFSSPYYQVQQNDVILIDKNRYSLRQTEQGRITQQIGFATSMISTIALLIALINK